MAEPGGMRPLSRPLLAAKWAIPPRRPSEVLRSRLHEKLLQNGATRLTTVVAPAGWGKTTLLSQWAHDPAESRRVAWVSLDQSDDEPTRFWTYVLTALGEHGLGTDALLALGAPGSDPLDVALPLLLNELKTMSADHVLVLDDYHVLSDPRLHESVEFFLAYLPPSLRVVLAGRTDPPLPLPRLRARGDLTEIRMDDLGFSMPETMALVTSVAGVQLDRPAVRLLKERTEGWAVGLQLAALTLKGRPAPAAAVDQIRGNDRHILDFFAAEVIDRLTPDQRQLLVETSVLERLSGPLCDAVLGRTNTAETLADLDRNNLFVVPLDNQREWYRCHRLFRDALRHELEPATSSRVLARAANWFLEQGFLDDAIALTIEAGDTAGAIRLLGEAVPWFLEHGAGRIERLGDRLGLDAVMSDPGLCASLAWAAAVAGEFHRMGRWLDAAEQSGYDHAEAPRGWHSLRGAVATLRSVQLLATSDLEQALASAERGVDSESDPKRIGFVLARHVLGTSYLANDRLSDAVPLLDDAWRRSRDPHFPPLLSLQAACSLALVLFRTGRYAEAGQVCAASAPAARVVERAWGDGAGLGIARLLMIEGRLALMAGDLSEAQRLAVRAVALSKAWGSAPQVVLALTSLAEVMVSTKDLVAAGAAVTEAREVVGSQPVWRFAIRDLEEVETRLGRTVVRAARRPGALVEELTDRELAILRMLPGTASQREIGAALYLSINTVKGYAKSLYRKLDATTRQEAVERARELNLI